MAALLWLVMNLGLCEWRELCCKMQCGMPSFWLFLLGNMAYLAIVLVQYAQTSTIIQGAFVPLLGWGTVLVSAIMIISSIFRKEDGPWNKIWLRMGMVLAGVLYISVSLALLNFLAGSSLADGPHVFCPYMDGGCVCLFDGVFVWTSQVMREIVSFQNLGRGCRRFCFCAVGSFLMGKIRIVRYAIRHMDVYVRADCPVRDAGRFSRVENQEGSRCQGFRKDIAWAWRHFGSL